MSDLSARVDALVARVRAACGPYRPLERVPASMREIHELALLVGDWARESRRTTVGDFVITPERYSIECRVCGARRDGLRDHEVRRFEDAHEHKTRS